MSTTDWPTLAPDIAAALERGPLGDRRRREVRENGGQTLRYGACGSLRLTLTGPAAGTWRDHEADASGGMLALVVHLGTADSPADAVDWLRRHGVTPPESPHRTPHRTPNGATPARSTPDRQNRRPERHSAPTGGLDRRALAALAASEAIPPAPDHPARRWLAAHVHIPQHVVRDAPDKAAHIQRAHQRLPSDVPDPSVVGHSELRRSLQR